MENMQEKNETPWTIETITELFSILDEYDHNNSLWTSARDGKPEFVFNCNDEFFWGCADGEKLSPEDLPLLRQSFEDVKATGTIYHFYGETVFICRKRGMRPQGCCYPDSVPEIWPLLDAAGPERETGMGNPYKPGEYRRKESAL